jgi:hypothetical protein
MDQRAEERVVLPVDRATQRGAEAGYRRQVERIFNPISLSALPERDPGLSKLPVDRLFISLAAGNLHPRISRRKSIPRAQTFRRTGSRGRIRPNPATCTEIAKTSCPRGAAPISTPDHRRRSWQRKNDLAALAGGHFRRGATGRPGSSGAEFYRAVLTHPIGARTLH